MSFVTSSLAGQHLGEERHDVPAMAAVQIVNGEKESAGSPFFLHGQLSPGSVLALEFSSPFS